MGNHLAFACAVNAAADRNQTPGIVVNLDFTQSDCPAGAEDSGCSLECGIDRGSQKIDAHVDCRNAPAELCRKTGVTGHVDQRCDDAAVIIRLVGRTAQLRPVGKADRQRSRLDIDRQNFRQQPLMKRRARQHRADEIFSFAGSFVAAH